MMRDFKSVSLTKRKKHELLYDRKIQFTMEEMIRKVKCENGVTPAHLAPAPITIGRLCIKIATKDINVSLRY